MKSKLSKLIITIGAVFCVGLGLAVNHNQQPNKVEAAQYLNNYPAYHYEGNYYNTIDFTSSEGMNGNLRASLTSLIYPKDFYTYGSSGETHLSTQLQYADEDPNNKSNMIYLYTRDSVKKNAASSWNREHVWPQSLSNNNWGTGGAGTDILHIRPTYNDTNSKRGNDLYGDNQKSGPLYYNNMLYGYNGGKYFEPLDEVKGDVARIVMYVWTAYKTYYTNMPSILNVFESYDVLLKWHTLDKPDVMEGNRNNYSETSKQKNRNPFVDHPELAWKIFGEKASSNVVSACKEAYPADGQIIVYDKNLVGIWITGEARKKDYYAGETFNPDGLTVTAYYDDQTSSEINVNNCTWYPDPLIAGATSVTCSYQGFTAEYEGITVSEREVQGGQFSVEFKNNGSDSGTGISVNNISNYWQNNTLVKSISNPVKIYPGANGLKIGSSSADGSITFNLVDDAKNNITDISITTTKYSGGGAFTVKVGNTTVASGVEAGSLFKKQLNYVSADTITISGTGRIYLNAIVLIAGDSGSHTSSSSSQYSSSSSSSISSSNISISSSSSSSESISSSSKEISSSKEEISSSSEQISSSEQLSSKEEISSSELPSSSAIDENSSTSEAPSVIDSSNSEPSSKGRPEDEEKSTGCNGSVVILPFTGFSALIGLIFVFSKKKK